MKQNFHKLSILCDPSHISGNGNYIKKISPIALDLNMDGLMIETHIDPSSALSDQEQQLTPHHSIFIIPFSTYSTTQPLNLLNYSTPGPTIQPVTDIRIYAITIAGIAITFKMISNTREMKRKTYLVLLFLNL